MPGLSNAGTGARILHWFAAGLIFAMLGMGLVMVHSTMAPGLKFATYQLHKSTGFFVLAVTLVRILWRVAGLGPLPPMDVSRWEYRLSRAVQAGLYGIVLAMIASGWLMASTAALRVPILLPGGFTVPFLADPDASLEAQTKLAHGVLSKLLIAAIVLHVIGAARHYRRLRQLRKHPTLPSRSAE